MRIRILASASRDLIDGYRFYEMQAEGVGAYDMKYWAGVTDNDWFEFLSQAGVDEVNFWQPSGKARFPFFPYPSYGKLSGIRMAHLPATDSRQ